MASLFTQMVQGKIPCHKIYEDSDCLAFLDIRPVKRGHALVIPKQEIDYLFDVDDALLGKLMLAAKKVAKGLKAVVPCKKIGVMVAGLEVPHTHVHLIPIDAVSDLNFAHATPADSEDLKRLADEVRSRIV